MAEVILMPRLSDTMTEGVIAAWHKNIGDDVKKGDVLAEIETDKATMELESYKEGILLHKGGEDGAKIPVDGLLCIIGKEGEDINDLIKDDGKATQNDAEQNTNKERPVETVSDTKVETASAQNENGSKADQNFDEAVLMPRLSDTMTEGVIAAWHKNIGDDVKKGDVLAEIETDKATLELESYKDGKMLYRGAEEGGKIAVNDLLCIIGKEGIDVNAIVSAVKGVSANASHPKSKEDTQKAEGDTAPPNAEVQNSENHASAQNNESGRIFASPLAKKLAEEKGIDLRKVKGTGDNNRITKTDIENYKAEQIVSSQKPASALQATDKKEAPIQPQKNDAAFTDIAVSQMRKTIARRLSESKFGAPHFYLTISIAMDAAIAARKKMNDIANVKISFNDLVLKAVAMSLQQHPKVNSSWMGDNIRMNHQINIGVAVAVDEGLLVPVVRDANRKSLSIIAEEVKTFAQKAKDKKLQPSDWEGSTFTISNLGMFGIEEFTAIINPPDACILAVGAINKIPVVKDDGSIGAGNIMKVTLSCDHRVVDGATGAAFLQTFKALLEEPLNMLV